MKMENLKAKQAKLVGLFAEAMEEADAADSSIGVLRSKVTSVSLEMHPAVPRDVDGIVSIENDSGITDVHSEEDMYLPQGPAKQLPGVKRQRRKDPHHLIRVRYDDDGFCCVWVYKSRELEPSSLLVKQVECKVGTAMTTGKVELLLIDGKRSRWLDAVGLVLGKAAKAFFRGFTQSAIPVGYGVYFEKDFESDENDFWEDQIKGLPDIVRMCFFLAVDLDEIHDQLEEMNDEDLRLVVQHGIYNFKKSIQLRGSRRNKQ